MRIRCPERTCRYYALESFVSPRHHFDSVVLAGHAQPPAYLFHSAKEVGAAVRCSTKMLPLNGAPCYDAAGPMLTAWSVAELLRVRARTLSSAWRRALATFAVVRVLASLAGLLGVGAVPAQTVPPVAGYVHAVYGRAGQLLFGLWERYDTLWYLRIAQSGYQGDSAAAFFPAYPALVRIAHFVCHDWLVAGLLVSNLAALVAFYLLYRLTEIEAGADSAERALWYQALYPGSIFLLAAYSESTFLALALAAFLAARLGRWGWAGLCGGALALTRNVGVAIALPLAIQFAVEWRRGRARLGEGLALACVPGALCGWMLFWRRRTGDALAFVHRQTAWDRHFAWPWDTLLGGVHQALLYAGRYPGSVYLLEALAMLGLLPLAALSLRKLPPAYGLLAALLLVPPLCNPFSGNELMSCLRFGAVVFPAFMTLGALVRRPFTDTLLRALFAGLFALSVTLFVTTQGMF